MADGIAIDLCGMLMREGSGFVLAADDGARFVLQLHRVPIDEVGKRVRVIGLRTAADLIEVEGVRLA